MANRAIFFITVETEEPTEIIIKHIKYQTIKKNISESCTIEFESILTWDSNSFKISSTFPITLTGIRFKLVNSDMEPTPVMLLKQEINKVDIFPSRSLLIKNNNHMSTDGKVIMAEFKPMLLTNNELAIIRFMTLHTVYS